jgi:U3 small nucleolar RNA-associated protein 7
MITLDPTVVGKMDRASKDVISKERQEEYDEAHPKGPIQLRNKARGKNSSLKRFLRKKQHNVVDQRKVQAYFYSFLHALVGTTYIDLSKKTLA